MIDRGLRVVGSENSVLDDLLGIGRVQQRLARRARSATSGLSGRNTTLLFTPRVGGGA